MDDKNLALLIKPATLAYMMRKLSRPAMRTETQTGNSKALLVTPLITARF
jgi:hypothetical protein